MGVETDEFAEFENAGAVQIGDSDASTDDKGEDKTEKRRGPPKEATKAGAIETNQPPADDDDQGGEGDDNEDEGGEGDDNEDEGGDDKGKKKPSAAEQQINRLKREKRDLQRQIREGASAGVAARLEAVEKRLSGENSGDNKTAEKKPAPDPSDLTKYPLGHLDDRYIEDKLEWLAEDKATKLADAALQREQGNERDRAAREAQAALLETVDDLAAKGSELYDDFQETVVDAGMRGDWDLSQTTFEAAAEADHGAQILYELSQDTKEASRVAKLSPLGQLKFVSERDAAITQAKKGRTKPKAGEPPANGSKGASSKTRISPATDDLDKFQVAWDDDAKGKS